MSQRYKDNIIRPKLQDTQLGILKNYAFYRKIQQRASGLAESTAGVMYEDRSENLPQLYLMVQGRAVLEHSSHIVKGGAEATF